MLPIRRMIRAFLVFRLISSAAYATLDTKKLISCTRTVLVDTTTSQQDSDGEVISVLEVHELLTIIHNILDNVLSLG